MKNRILLPTHHTQIAWARNKPLLFLKPLGVILGAPQEVQYHRPLGLLTEKNLARGKVLEKTLESPLDCKIKLVNSKGNQSWIFTGRTDAEAETPILWPPESKNWLTGKDPDAGRDWGAGGEGDDRGCDGWMASPTRWTWVWVNSGSWWWTGRPGVPRFMGLQRVGHDWATELNWLLDHVLFYCIFKSCDELFFTIFGIISLKNFLRNKSTGWKGMTLKN